MSTSTSIDPAEALRKLNETCDRLEQCTYFDVGKDSIEAMREAAAALEASINQNARLEDAMEDLLIQAEQMSGLCDDDREVEAAIEKARDALYGDPESESEEDFPTLEA